MKYRIWIVVVCGCLGHFVDAHFSTLHDLQKYADAYPEIVISDNNDWANPRYTKFYDANRPTIVTKLQRFLGSLNNPVFDAQEFKNLISRLYKQRLDIRNTNNETDTHSCVLNLKSGETCFLWGDIHGAFHSLVRSLHELKKLGVINDQLVITDESYHFIFLGDVINRSSYSLETLTVVLTLMEKNPHQVLYVRGLEESDHFWENFTMRHALQAYAFSSAEKSDGAIPLKTLLNKFFDTLPRIVELYKENDDTQVIYCMHDETQLKRVPGKNVRATIYGERYENVDPLKIRYGLEYLGFSQGIAEWTIMSCPVELYQKFFNFYYDVFVALEMGSAIETSIITLYNHDVRGENKDFTATSYDLIFGETIPKKDVQRLKPFTKKPVFNFGSTMDLSGVVSSLGGNIKRGIDVFVKEENMNNEFDGGITKELFKPIIFDDVYDPRIAYKNIESLLHGFNIRLLLAPVGTATLLLSLDKIKNGDISVLFPVTGYPGLRDSALKHMVHFRASYADEACALIDYIIKAYGAKKIAFFYQDDAYGQSSLAAAHAELKKHNLESVIDIAYLRGQFSFKEEVEKLKKTNADAIGLFSASLSTQIFLNEIGVEYLKGKHLFAMSFLESEDLKKYLFDKGIKQTFSFVVPNPAKSDLPIVKEYRTAMKKYGLRIDANSLEGWIVMRLLLDALQHISGPCTAEKIIAYFETYNKYDLGGLKLTFNPETRSFDLPVLIENEDGVLIEYQQCKSVENQADRKFLM